jgi:hypothetical protein
MFSVPSNNKCSKWAKPVLSDFHLWILHDTSPKLLQGQKDHGKITCSLSIVFFKAILAEEPAEGRALVNPIIDFSI